MTHACYHEVEADSHRELGRKLGDLFGEYLRTDIDEAREHRDWRRMVSAAKPLLEQTRKFLPRYVEELEAYAESARCGQIIEVRRHAIQAPDRQDIAGTELAYQALQLLAEPRVSVDQNFSACSLFKGAYDAADLLDGDARKAWCGQGTRNRILSQFSHVSEESLEVA